MDAEKKILVIQTAFPGDVILTLPFIQELKKKYNDYLIDALCIPSTFEIFSASPYVNTAIVFDKKGKQKSIFAFLKFVKELRSNNYEIVFSPHRSFRSAIIVLNIAAKSSFGFDNSSLQFAFKKVVKYDHSAHEVKRNLDLINDSYSEDRWKILPELKVNKETEIKVKNFLSDNQIQKFITIASGSVWETKKYPAEYYKQVVNHFSKLNFKIVLVGGSNDKSLCEDIRLANEEKIYITAGEFSFIDTIELLKHTSLLICNDSAPSHLGVCADIPVLTIYCSTTPNFGFYPYNSKSDYISFDDLKCKPCGIHGYNKCPIDTFDCAKLLSPELVIIKAEKMLLNAN